MIPRTLTIAGSDSSGGAGIQADLKTFQEFGTFGFSALTSIVTMDPDEGWSHLVTPLDPDLVEKQLKTIFTGEPIAALKTGMLGTIGAIEAAEAYIKKYQVENVVIDPVMACKGTTELLQPENVYTMRDLLLPLAKITTPNLVEAAILAGVERIDTLSEMKAAAIKIHALGPEYVVIKGGRRFASEKATDLFYDGETFTILESALIDTDFNHGAGCTFAAATTAGLAKGLTPLEAVTLAKDFVHAAIEQGVEINQYLGHVWHGAYFQAENRLAEEVISS